MTKVHVCSRKSASEAVHRWHYSRRMPRGQLFTVGVTEHGRFAGAIVFGAGTAPEPGRDFGLEPRQVVELCRVALRDDRETPTTSILSAAVRHLRRARRDVAVVVSYADIARGHHGGLYQAASWTYLGLAAYTSHVRLRGEVVHPRTLYHRYGTSSVAWLREHVHESAALERQPPKHKYAIGLTRKARRTVRALARPYPKPGTLPTLTTTAAEAPLPLFAEMQT